MFAFLFLTTFLSLLSFICSTLISHDHDLERKTSPNNLISFDIIDDSTFDIHYNTDCQDCRCSVHLPLLNYEPMQISQFTQPVTDSCMVSNRLYLLHSSGIFEASYSIFEVQLPSVITPIIKETRLPALDGFKNAKFFADDLVFAGYSQNSLVVYTLDQQGQVQENKYTSTVEPSLQGQEDPSDFIYTKGTLFVARGALGLEILSKNSQTPSELTRVIISAKDFEMGPTFKPGKLELDASKNILYVYDPNSTHDCLVALDISNGADVSLINNYHIGSLNLVQVIPTASQQLLAVTRLENTCYLMRLSGSSENKYADFDLNNVWEIPGHVQKVRRNGDKILIETEEELYLLRKDLPYELQRSDLIVDVVGKSERNDFFPLGQEDSTYLVSLDESSILLASVQPRGPLSLDCGIFRQGYTGSVVRFNVSVYKDSCAEATNKSDENICLEQYKYDVEFQGTDVVEPVANALGPKFVQLSTWNEIVSNASSQEPDSTLPTPETPVKQTEIQHIRASSPNNIIVLDIIDTSTFDIHYNTECQDCSCSVNLPYLNYDQKASLPFTQPVTDSGMVSNRLYILHSSATGEASYSVFEVTLPNIFNSVITAVRLPALDGFKNVKFFADDLAFVGYSQNLLVVYTLDQQGQVQENKYTSTADSSLDSQQESLDMIYTKGMLFIARGSQGLEILTIAGSDFKLTRNVFSAKDFEMGTTFLPRKLELDSSKSILYVYDPNSTHDCLVALDISNAADINLVNTYHIGSLNIVQVIPTSRQLFAVTRFEDNCYLLQLSGASENKYADLSLNNVWEIPGHVQNVKRNGNKILIENESFLYIFRKDLPYEAQSNLIIDIVGKNLKNNFYPLGQEDSTYLVSVDASSTMLASVPQRGPLSLECKIFKQGYTGSVETFNISLYKDSCAEASNTFNNGVCQELYQYDVEFQGTDGVESDFGVLAPKLVPLSDWTHILSSLTPNDTSVETGNNGTNGTVPEPTNNETNTPTTEPGNNGTVSEPTNNQTVGTNETNTTTTEPGTVPEPTNNQTTQTPEANNTTNGTEPGTLPEIQPIMKTSPNNMISFDIIDDSTFDIHYSAECFDCSCSVNLPLLNYDQKASLPFTQTVTDSGIVSNKLYVLHSSAKGEVSYSVFEATLPKTFTQVITQARLPALDGFKNARFFADDLVFAGYSQNSLVVYNLDQQGKVQENKYTSTADSSFQQEPSDMIYAKGMLFIARGDLGLEILDTTGSGSQLTRTVFLAKDFEMGTTFLPRKLELDSSKNILYVYDPNSTHDCLVALDISNSADITLVNNYHIGSLNIVQVIPTARQLFAVTRLQDNCFILQLFGGSENKYVDLDLNNVWEIPGHVQKVRKNNNKILIETDDNLYIFRKDLPYKVQSDLIIDIISKNGKNNFYPLGQEDSTYLVSVDASSTMLASVPQRGPLDLECRISTQDYADSFVRFNVSVYKDSCTEASNKIDNDVCQDQYQYDVEFSGLTVLEQPVNSWTPKLIPLSNWDQVVADGNKTVENPKPNTTNTTETKNDTKKEDDPSKAISDDGGTVTDKPDQGKDKPKPDDKPISEEVESGHGFETDNTFVLVIGGILALLCIGFIVKRVYNFVKKYIGDDSFRHQKLPDEENSHATGTGIEIKEIEYTKRHSPPRKYSEE